MEQRIPPQSLEAEQSVLGGLMLEGQAWDEVADLIKEDDFYKPSHRKIFAAIRELNKKNLPTDLVTLTNLLLEKGDLEAVGGPSYLAEMMDIIPSVVNIATYAKMVQQKAVLRSLIQASQGFADRAYRQDFEDVESFLDQVEAEVFSIAQQKTASGLVEASDLVKASLERLESLYSKKLSVTGVSTGFLELDNLTSGFQPGDLIIVAARPSMGKTAFSLNIALNAALLNKSKVAYFSLEMGKEQVMIRMLASSAKVRLSDMRVGHIDDKSWPRLINTAAELSESGIFIDDTSGISPFEIRAKARRLKAKHGLDMIMVDYLQLMSMKQKVESREREVSEISKLLKSVAKELQVPVVALAQLNRGVEGRSDRRPMLSDLRESGSIEQDADVIMMIYREDYYDRDNPDIKGVAEIIVGKQRNGPTDVVRLRWQPEFGRFENLVPQMDAPMPSTPPPQGPQPGGSPRGRRSPPPNLAPVG